MIILIIAPVSDLRSGLQTVNTVVARITQLVECWFNKPVVEGSIPSLGIVQKLFVFISRRDKQRTSPQGKSKNRRCPKFNHSE